MTYAGKKVRNSLGSIGEIRQHYDSEEGTTYVFVRWNDTGNELWYDYSSLLDADDICRQPGCFNRRAYHNSCESHFVTLSNRLESNLVSLIKKVQDEFFREHGFRLDKFIEIEMRRWEP